MGRSLGSPLDGHAALKDLGRIVSEMSNMKATMREMARSARLRQQEDIVARNQRAREQVKHEFVMRNVAKSKPSTTAIAMRPRLRTAPAHTTSILAVIFVQFK